MKHHVALRFSLMLFLLLILAACNSASSAPQPLVERRDGDITVLPNGDIVVVETWEVTFPNTTFHRAYRTIPLKTGTAITDLAVYERGQAYERSKSAQKYTFDVVQDKQNVTINWYFPSSVNPTRTFDLHYTIENALYIYPEGDQIWLKFIERDRSYTINSSHVVVHLPGSFNTAQLRGETYLDRRVNQGAQILDGQTVAFTGGPFPPGTEWEVRAQFPHGVVATTVQPWQIIADKQPVYNMISLFAALVIGIVGCSGLYVSWDMFGRDKPVGKIAHYYTQPPDNTPPGMVGLLIDEHADLRDIIATIIDLAQRGYIRIAELTGTSMLASNDFVFIRTGQDESTLRSYEQCLMQIVFGTNDRRFVSDLRNHFHASIPQLQQSLYAEALHSGYFARDPQAVRFWFAVIGLILMLVTGIGGAIGYYYLAPYAPYSIWAFIAAGTVALGFLALGPFMPKKTRRGATIVAKWQAFKRFLQHIERYTNVAEARDQFNLYLPYAIAFGFERRLVEKFSKVSTPIPTWYQPNPVLLGGIPGYYGAAGGASLAAGGAATDGTLPSLDNVANNLNVTLDNISMDFFNMLDATASAFTSQGDLFDAAGGEDGLLSWIGSDGDSGGDWSGGFDIGGGGFGGGSSGFE